MTINRYSRRRGSMDALLTAASRSGMSRRDFLKRLGVTGAALAVGPSVLAACSSGTEATTTSAGGATSTAGGQTTTAPGCAFASTGTGDNTKLNFANWPFYIDVSSADQENGGYFDTTSLEDFEKQTGITVNYVEEVNDNNEWFAKVQAQMSQCQDIQRDLTVLTDWMAARFIRLGWAAEIDKANVPNAANLVESLQHPGFDPNRTYTLPWQSGLTGIGYNPTLTGRKLTSINDIFDPAFANKVTMLTEMRDTLGLVMLGMGIDPAQATVDDAQKAADKIKQYVDNGHIRRFTGNDYTDDLANGNVAVAFAWSGDIVQLQADNPDLEFLIPDEGLMIWSDNMLIPNGAANKKAAEEWMNFYYQPKVAAKVESWVNYICPVKGAKEAMVQLGDEIGDEDVKALADEPLIFPDDATLAKTHIFKTLDDAEERQFNDIFEAVIGA